jgi:hypothetical protein
VSDRSQFGAASGSRKNLPRAHNDGRKLSKKVSHFFEQYIFSEISDSGAFFELRMLNSKKSLNSKK